MTPSLPPDEAWQRLPAADWNAAAAGHLLRRAAWTARPGDAERAAAEGLEATLDRLFPEAPILWPPPPSVTEAAAELPAFRRRVALAPSDEKARLRREENERTEAALRDMSIDWLRFASRPENAAFAKWVLFLSNVFVVSMDKVRNAPYIHRHIETLAEGAFGPAPDLAKAVSRSPAMMIYLDLEENKREAPNENFARELFELFLLGEGNYTEQDIKQAARAFTGYRLQPQTGRFAFARRQHDFGKKTVFGQSGDFDGDDIIDLAYGLRAAGAHLPVRMSAAYLSDDPLPPEYAYALGDRWRSEGGYNLKWLVRTFFSSRLFHARQFQGNLIKSPIQFYLGMLADLHLETPPLPRYVLNPLRQMEQRPFAPPNVRGWVGGRAWINSAALEARRATVERVFTPFDEDALTADEQRNLDAARAAGARSFWVPDTLVATWAAAGPAEAAAGLERAFLAESPSPAFEAALAKYLAAGASDPSEYCRRLRRAAVTLFSAPEYQIC